MSKYSSKHIEEKAINELQRVLLGCSSLESYLSTNDKTPFLDGNILVYSGSTKKQNYIGKIPLQIKSTGKVLRKETCTYSMKVVDLEAFRRDGGCLLFYISVDIINDLSTIYYANLQVYDLNILLDKCYNKKQTSITMMKFPSTESEIYSLCHNFIIDANKQRSFIDNTYSIKGLLESGVDISSLSIEFATNSSSPHEFDKYVTTHEFYVYAQIKNLNISIPAGKITKSTLKRNVVANVSVNDRVYYDSYTIITSCGKSTVNIGKSLCFSIDDSNSKLTFKFKWARYLDDRIKDLEFLLSVVENRCFSINDERINLGEFDDFEFELNSRHLRYLKDIQTMLIMLGVKSDLDCNLISENDNTNICNMVDSVLYNRKISFVGLTETITYAMMKIANLEIMIWLNSCGDGYYRISSFFEKKTFAFFEESDVERLNPILASHCLLLTEENLSYASNLDVDFIYSDIIEKNNDLLYVEKVQLFMLRALNAYDKDCDNRRDMLELAQNLCSWISMKYSDEDDLQLLNELQIKKRMNTLNSIDLSRIGDVIQRQSDPRILCGAYILLDDEINAKKYIALMDENAREGFKTYPIYHLLNIS